MDSAWACAYRRNVLALSTLPLYIIDKKDLIKSMLSPSMSEGVCLLENKLLILFESAAKKYRLLTKCEVYKIWESEF